MIEELDKINELIRKCVENYSEQAEEYEIEVKEIVRKCFRKIKTLLEEVNEINEEDEEIIDDNFFRIFRLKSKEIVRNLDNVYIRQIVNVFSINNNELIDILKKGKRNDFTNLIEKTFKKANDELLIALDKSVKEQQEFIEIKLENYLKGRQDLLETSKRESENILKILGENKEKRFKLEKKYDYIINKLKILEDLMEV